MTMDYPSCWSLYRIYDADDVLLYIGVTKDVQTRIEFHLARSTRQEASWAIRRRMARHTVQALRGGPIEALAAEREAIKAEAPLLNKVHNPQRFRRVGGRYLPVCVAAPSERAS